MNRPVPAQAVVAAASGRHPGPAWPETQTGARSRLSAQNQPFLDHDNRPTNEMTPQTNIHHSVTQNYQPDADPNSLATKVAAMLATLPPGKLTGEQLGALDQFHAGGLTATRKLAELAGIERGAKVLDAGAGLGGPARFLAEAYDCEVVGVDLTPGFVTVAQTLTARTGLQEKVRFQIGDLTALPFADGSFDVVWTQHVVMNIHDRARLYREIRRVLKPGGKFAFHDAVAADEKLPLIFPVPWAKTQETSCLLNKAETLAVLQETGLASRAWRDVSPEALAFFAQLQSAPPPTPLSLAGLYGPEVRQWVGNFARNLQEGHLALVMGVCEAASTKEVA